MSLTAFDFETHPIQLGLPAPPVVCGSIADDSGCHIVDAATALIELRKLLSNPLAHVVGCNIAFDLVCAAAAQPDLLPLIFSALEDGRVHDVAIREALIDIAKGDLLDAGDDGVGIRYSLATLVSRYLGRDIEAEKKDGWRMGYALLEGTPIEQWPWAARVYPMRDVAFPLEIFKRQEGGENLHNEGEQVRAAFALMLMRTWGLRTNAAAVKALRERVESVDRENTVKFQQLGILRANGSENKKALAAMVTAAYQGNPPMTAPSGRHPQGQVSADRDTLAESGDPVLEAYSRAGKNDKYLSTYLPILEKGIAQPWNPEFNVLVATTRISSDAQQFPQSGGVRECIESRTGTVFCSVDYGGLELRTMSQRAIWEVGYSKMAEALNSGQDPHLIAAASFRSVSLEVAVKGYKSGDAAWKAFRDLGKIWNFGKGGGMGAGAMVYNAREGKNGATTKAPDGTVYVGSRFCILTGATTKCGEAKTPVKVRGKSRLVCQKCLEVAKRLDAGWLAAWPEQAELFARANRKAKGSRYIEVTIPVSNVKRGKCGYTQFLNTPFQGMGAVATKRAMWRIAWESYNDRISPLWGSRPVLNVHDEILAEMPEARAPEAAERLALIMREELAAVVPDLAKAVEAEPALSRTMSKGAKTLRDANGRLLVWA